MEARTLKEKGVWESRKIPYFLASILCPSLFIPPNIRDFYGFVASILKIFCFFPEMCRLFAKKKAGQQILLFVVNEDMLI